MRRGFIGSSSSLKSLTLATLLLFSSIIGSSYAQSLTDAQVRTVRQRLADVATRSWELGTRAQVLIEFDSAAYDVLSPSCKLPPNTTNPPSSLDTPFSIVRPVVDQSTSHAQSGNGSLMDDGSVADPASLGVTVLLANWTGAGNGADFGGAAQRELSYLLEKAPKTAEGAISHRMDKTQLWSDFIYMVPPFLAYYGALHENKTLMDEAFNQISLYRDKLHDGDSGNLWRHIVLGGDGEDAGRWSTGNGWAAMGMLRVLGTYKASSLSRDYGDKIGTLEGWVDEILHGMYDTVSNSNTALFNNYADQPKTFRDGSSTALIAAAAYRLAVLSDGGRVGTIPKAEKARRELSKHAGDAGGHIDGDGWLSPVVDPHNFPVQGSRSPEGQAFVVSMIAGYKAWNAAGQPGINAASSMRLVSMQEVLLAGLVTFAGWALVDLY
ncbi:hypothetical protein FRC18_012092 [Serendipita sp. 400]|nr:hypothetical protein FRC18_012092 [Serendipita sp. 400]